MSNWFILLGYIQDIISVIMYFFLEIIGRIFTESHHAIVVVYCIYTYSIFLVWSTNFLLQSLIPFLFQKLLSVPISNSESEKKNSFLATMYTMYAIVYYVYYVVCKATFCRWRQLPPNDSQVIHTSSCL